MSAANKKPRIGLNLSNRIEEGSTQTMKINDDYVDAVVAAGGIPLLIPQIDDEQALEALLCLCHGFILTGGDDYDPRLWGENDIHPSVQLCHERRRTFDMLLVGLLLRSDLPILGICGGHQLINIGAGGSLYQDIFSHDDFPVVLPHRHDKAQAAHDVTVASGSLLQAITGSKILAVNSTHHMAVKQAGRGLTVSARAADGCVEAVESTDPARFILGVQWHPEALTHAEEHLGIFRYLVKVSGDREGRQEPGRRPAGFPVS